MAGNGGGESREMSGSAKLDRAAFALASGQTQVQAALHSDISVRTIQRRLLDPAFRSLIDGHRQRMLSEAIGRLTLLASRAVMTLHTLMGEDQPAATRLGAARSVLSSVVELQSHAEVIARLAAIEADLATLKPGGPSR